MKKIRVLLANRPRLMREVMREILESQPDMEVVGEVLDPLGLLVAVREMEADSVVLALRDSEESGLRSHLLAEYPNLTILCLASEGETAFIEQLCPRRKEIIDPSEASILNALRHSVREPCPSKEENGKLPRHG